MSGTLSGVIENREVQGPFEGKFGEFKKLLLTVNGKTAGKILKPDDEQFQLGTKVHIITEDKAGKEGKVFTNIVKVMLAEDNNQEANAPWSEKVVIQHSNTRPVAAASSSTIQTKGEWETRAERNERQGKISRSHAITTAVALLGPGAKLANVKQLANDVLKYTETGE